MMLRAIHIACGGFAIVSCVALTALSSSEKGQVGVGTGLLQSLLVITKRQAKEIP